jgi:hypothetical protein
MPFQFVILVGGFGQSEYLREYLKEKVTGNPEFLQAAGERPYAILLLPRSWDPCADPCKTAGLQSAGAPSSKV